MIPVFLGPLLAMGQPLQIALSSISLTDTQETPAIAINQIDMETNGNLKLTEGTLVTNRGPGEWASPLITGIGSKYEYRLSKLSGTDPDLGSSALATWLAGSSNRGWFWQRDDLTSVTFTGTLEVGLVGTSTAIASASVSISVTSTAGGG